MQTFSTMRRNSTHKNNLRIFFLSVFFIIYVAITDIYYLLPPLFGVTFVLAQEKYEEESYGIFYFLVPFFLYFEASKGLPLSSSILFILFSFMLRYTIPDIINRMPKMSHRTLPNFPI